MAGVLTMEKEKINTMPSTETFTPYAIAYLREGLEVVQIVQPLINDCYVIRKGMHGHKFTVEGRDLFSGFEEDFPGYEHVKVDRYFHILLPENEEKWMDEGNEDYDLTDIEEREIDQMIEFYDV